MNENTQILSSILTKDKMLGFINSKRKLFYDKIIPLFYELSDLYNEHKKQEILIFDYDSIKVFFYQSYCYKIRVELKGRCENRNISFYFDRDRLFAEYPVEIYDSNNNFREEYYHIFSGDYQEYFNIVEIVDILLKNKKEEEKKVEREAEIEELVKCIFDNIKTLNFDFDYNNTIDIINNDKISVQYIINNYCDSFLQISLESNSKCIKIIESKDDKYSFAFSDDNIECNLIEILYIVLNTIKYENKGE